jgi:hypothetical protein
MGLKVYFLTSFKVHATKAPGHRQIKEKWDVRAFPMDSLKFKPNFDLSNSSIGSTFGGILAIFCL